ncbi:chitinase [Psychromonas sp. Urea-02u-13]|uniref:chitinase n=1 Tax=Psychromonas sp. Urea-02u-13 TaxID=2058326 RepID=UPI000C3293CE|nr:chitinase [Psychromonas sp. Urea-02u-13]PKG39316.1 chitin-binding protein [Psychromonas sp. Urea-02u-13]
MFKFSPAKKAVSIALLSSSLTLLASHSAFAAEGAISAFVPGKTKVSNGDVVSYKGECFSAKHNPGTWETPSAASWFWDVSSCNNIVTPTGIPTPVIIPTPISTPTPVVVATPFIAGKTKAKNGDIVSYKGECFVAKNNPGTWETPSVASWFWELAGCDSVVITPTPVVITPTPVFITPTPVVITPTPIVITPTPVVITPTPIPPFTGELSVTEDGNGGFLIPRAQLSAIETELTSGELFDLIRADAVTLDNIAVEAVLPMRLANPDNVLRAESIIDSALWEFLFPIRNEAYTYRRFLQAIAKFPAFCRTYEDGRDSDAICKRSMATMFAHFTQETGAHAPGWEGAKGNPEWRQGLYYLREMYKSESDTTGPYNACSGWQGERWPCAKDKSYFGRGAKQLSWNYNYGPFSEAMFGDKDVLLENPDLVADTWLNLASAVFFYVYPQPPKPSMLHVIDGTWQPNAADKAAGIEHGFGATIQIINGAFECNKGTTSNQAKSRIAYYKEFSNYLNLDISAEKLDCADMKAFNTDGAGALMINWDKDWGWDANTPANHSFKCKLAGYQTAYSAWASGDYEMCVEDNFNTQATDGNGVIIPKGE